MTNRTVFICTVGGSHQPIVTAVHDLRPDFVCFVCSGRDPGTGKPGSEGQITGKDLCIKADPREKKPSLPNIPAQAGIDDDSYEVEIVPADDLDNAVVVIRKSLLSLLEKFPGARIIADYTGGTKTMTAALVAAVLETDGVDLQLVTGNRADLVQVRDGTEISVAANIEALRFERSVAPYLAAWQRFAYDEAAEGLATVKRPTDRMLNSRLTRARDLSNAFAAWDRFDHDEALRLLDMYANVISDQLGVHLGALKALTAVKSTGQEPMKLFDLWRNAERRATQGRYDDAVARLYRLLEWTAQWLLRTRCGINTSDIPPEKIPSGISISADREGKYQAGLYNSWQLVSNLIDGSAGCFASEQLAAMFGHVEARNRSIFAHGYKPVGRRVWEEQYEWTSEKFLPMLLEEAKTVRIHKMPPQLPREFLWDK